MRPASRCFGVYVALLIVLSPAKRLDFTPPAVDVPSTPRRCAGETAELAKVTRLTNITLLPYVLMLVAIALYNVARFESTRPDPQGVFKLPQARAASCRHARRPT